MNKPVKILTSSHMVVTPRAKYLGLENQLIQVFHQIPYLENINIQNPSYICSLAKYQTMYFLPIVEGCDSVNACQLDWDTRCPSIWLNTILAVSLIVFLSEINICISRLNKTDHLPQYEWASSNPLKV